MKIAIVIIFLLFASGCGESQSQNEPQNDIDDVIEKIDGTWKSLCKDTTISSFDPESSNILIVYNGNTAEAFYNRYSDSSCSTLFSSEPLLDTQFGSPALVGETYVYGDLITTDNGVKAREIIYSLYGQNIYDIYIIQDNNSTLILGKRCPPRVSGLQPICIDTKPTELDYTNYYTRQI